MLELDEGGMSLGRIESLRGPNCLTFPFAVTESIGISLIELLSGVAPIPIEEVVWSLEAISGLALVDDRVRWTQWWGSLTKDATELLRQ
jgi:hypothetical protein